VPTIRDYFDREAQSELSVSNTFTFAVGEPETVDVPARLVTSFHVNATFLALFVPHVRDPAGFIAGLCRHLDRILSRLSEGPQITVGRRGERPARRDDLTFAGRVFVYAEDELPEEALREIGDRLRSRGMHLRFRGPEYARAQTAQERPLGFISYDSGDRASIAEPLALALNAGSCPVWFDQYAMRLGDRLEGTLLEGIDECLRCIVILSQRYLSNHRWARWEFERMAEREARDGYALIIPVRCGVTEAQVKEFSPILADRRSIEWNPDPDAVRRIASDLAITLFAVGRERERDAIAAARAAPRQDSLGSRIGRLLRRLRR
jgi:hypothetical protein